MKVLYHGGCNDGFAAALICRRVHPNAEYIPVYYNQPFPSGLVGQEVLILDFCYGENEMLWLKNHCKLLEVLDHHASQEEITKKYGVYDATKSGAMLACEWFYPHDPAPDWVKYIQDYDLWQFKMPNSREWSAGLNLYPRDFDLWQGLFEKDDSANFLIGKGETILEYQRTLVDQIVKHAIVRDIFGHQVPCVNTSILHDLVGERLCQGQPFSATYYDREDGKRKWSLRSMADNSGMDVKALALTIPGGGGHRNAAGFCTLNPDVIEITND